LKKIPAARTFFAAFFLLFLFSAPVPSGSAILLDRVVAVVNKEVITWSELYKMMEYEATEQVKKMKDEERAKIFKENEALFLDKIIDLKLQVQEAKNLGLDVTPDEAKEAIENVKKKYSLTDKSLEESLKKEGLTLEDYKKRISEQILLSNIVNQKIRSKIVVSEADVSKYTEANKVSFDESESFRLKQIFFRKPKDDADRKALEDKSSLIIQKLQAGEDFSSLAKEYSEDPSASVGGDMGNIKKDVMAKEFIDVLSSLKPGDFSKPFWTDTGIHIIKLDERVSVKTKDEIRENVRKQMLEEQFNEKYKSWIKSLREKARIEIRL
jgi:peptidyl-prolyl cis-trans isomerase SurA